MKNPKNQLIQDFQQVGNIGLPINNQAVYIPTAAFPNTNLLYGWRNGLPVQGGIALTKNGTIGQAVDHSGNTSECDFTGAGYYSSTDSAFAFTGSFSIGFWMYRKDWAKTYSVTNNILARYTGTNGWVIQEISGTTQISFSCNAVSLISVDVAHLASGWHFISLVREVSPAMCRVSVDGVRIGTNTTAVAITAGNELEIGAAASGVNKLQDSKISDIWIHNGTAWTDAQVKAIYAASCPQATYNQKLAGHRVATVEAGQTASEVLAHYKFGTDLTLDEKGSFPLTAVGTPSQAEDIFGNMGAIRFQGGGQAYTNANLLSTAPNKGIWISAWVKGELYDSNEQVIFGRAYTSGLHNIVLAKATNGYYNVGYGANYDKKLYSITPCRVGRWEKFDVCWDTINGLRLFVNGVLEATDTTATTLPTFNATYPFQIGRYFNGSVSVPFTGSICDLKVLDKVPTQKDIDMAYASTFVKPDGFKGADIVVRPSADSTRERREKIQCYVDNGIVYRQGMRQLYGDCSSIVFRQKSHSGIFNSSVTPIGLSDDWIDLCTRNSAGDFSYNFAKLRLSVKPSVVALFSSSNGVNDTFGLATTTTSTSTTRTTYVRNGTATDPTEVHIKISKQGPDFLPEGFVACNSHDLIQIRGEK